MVDWVKRMVAGRKLWPQPDKAAHLAGKWAILVALSFVMLYLGDRLNASGMALTRFMARAQAPLTAQLHYPDPARDQITVLLYDQSFLDMSSSAWPVSYREHADQLLRLVEDPRARPKAIMLDVTFGQMRDDPTVDLLQQALCRIQREFKVPVFLAALAAPQGLVLRPGLEARPAGAEACFTLVGVDYLPDPLDGVAWSYPLSRHLSTAAGQPPSWESGPGPADAIHYRSAAMAMAQDAAGLALGAETVPMALVWGLVSAEQAERPTLCRPGQPDWQRLVPGVLRQLWEDAPTAPLCPYHRTLSVAQMGSLPEDLLATYLGGKYVLVGAQVPGYNDFAHSPVHGNTLPGVLMHAMALDNLLTYGGNYKLHAEWTLPPAAELVWPGIAGISVVFLVHELTQLFKKWTPLRCLGLVGWGGLTVAGPRRSKLQQVPPLCAGVVVWLLQLTLQTAMAMVVIAALQYWFRIGMLPVVELVSMTLVAEGLGIMEKIATFINPPPVEPPPENGHQP